MESVWYYARDGAQAGPVSFEDLKATAAAGKLGPDDLVWKEGTADWVAARTVAGLIGPAAAGPPPQPARTPPAPPPAAGSGATPVPAAQPAPLSIYDEKREWPSGEKMGAAEIFALAKEFLARATAANPAAINPNVDEEKRLTKSGYDSTTSRFAAWRRAVLWVAVVPTAFAALFGLIGIIDMERDQKDSLSGFGIFLFYLQAFALFVLPVAATLGALAYDRLGKSARLVLVGGIISLAVPIGIAFVPAEWFLDLKIDSSQTVGSAEAARAAGGVLLGINFYLVLTPMILSLLPSVSRGCLRIKCFLPESLVPGWGLVASVPLFVLLTMATFVVVYHVAGNLLLIVGLILWVGSPLLYLTKFRMLTRPVTDNQELAQLRKTQNMVLCSIGLGILLLIIYLFTAKVGGMTIMGSSQSSSLVRPWSLSLHAKWIEYIGRSLFLTVLFADLLTRMSVMVWREQRAFAGSAAAVPFERTISGLGTAIEIKSAPPVS